MATIIVETGAQITGSNSYVSVADFEAYSDAIGDDSYQGTSDADLCVALTNAAIYLSSRYFWRGRRAEPTQTLAWPRREVVDDDGYRISSDAIPSQVISAQCEAAIRFLNSGKLIADVQPSQMVTRKQVTAGSVETDVSYATGILPIVRYPEISALLRGLIYSNSSILIRRS